MTDRIPEVPPIILPVVVINEEKRPLWSVMIPVYNCIIFLEETLRSVLIQDFGEALMQIEVVDDCSTDGDVKALVEVVGKGRVKYFRQEQNQGNLRNFETCLNRSKGQWVHLLHGDDKIERGYYQEIEKIFSLNPEAGAAFTNFSYISKQSNKLLDMDPPTLSGRTEILPNFLFRIASRQLIQPPAIVVKREVYEHLGSFYAVHYGEDWEMWTRIAAHYPIAYSPRCLASYRVSGDVNITQQAYLTGQNARDLNKVINIIQNYLPPENRKKLKKKALKFNSILCAVTANILYPTQKAAAFMQAKEAWKINKNVITLYYISKFYLKTFIHYKE
ncbi:MAG: glycosyltransferase [Janthinobacterium lividum]